MEQPFGEDRKRSTRGFNSRVHAYFLPANWVLVADDMLHHVVIFGQEWYDELGEYDVLTGIFTPLHTGYYSIVAIACSSDMPANTYLSTNIYINGLPFFPYLTRDTVATFRSHINAAITILRAGQPFYIGSRNYDGFAAHSFIGGSQHGSLMIHRLS